MTTFSTFLSIVAIFHYCVILSFVYSTVIFWTELSCWCKRCWNKSTLSVGWSHRYNKVKGLVDRYEIFISQMAMDIFPLTYSSLCSLFSLLSELTLVKWRVSLKKIGVGCLSGAPRYISVFLLGGSVLLNVFCVVIVFYLVFVCVLYPTLGNRKCK